MKTVTRSLLFKIPIGILFLYIFYLCILYHSRALQMSDFGFVFDSWWYFIHRLREGEFPLWNPYALFGKMNVQWNLIPAFLMTPFIMGSELTLEDFKNSHILGSFLIILAFYSVGRINHYCGYLTLIPLLFFLATTSFNTQLAFLPYVNKYVFFPIGVAVLASSFLKNKFPSLVSWCLYTILMSLSLLGTRTDLMLQNYVAQTTFFLSILLSCRFIRSQYKDFLVHCALSLVATFLATAWQLPFIVVSALNTYRIPFEFSIKIFTEPLFLDGVKLSLLRETPFLIALISFILYQFGQKDFLRNLRVPIWIQMIVTGLFFGSLIWIFENLIPFPYASFHPSVVGFSIRELIGIYFCFSLIILFVYSLFVKTLHLPDFFCILAAIFLGVGITLEFNYLPIDLRNMEYRTYAFFFFFMTCMTGTFSFCIIKKSWWLPGLIMINAFIGQTGTFIFNDVVGIPWIYLRAITFLFPFIFLILLEGTQTISRTWLLLAKRYKIKLYFNKYVLSSNLKVKLYFNKYVFNSNLVGPIFCFSITLFFLKTVFLPMDEKYFITAEPFKRDTIASVEANAFDSNTRAYSNSYLRQAMDISLKIRDLQVDFGSQKRVSPHLHVQFDPVLNYFFMFPSFTQKLNDSGIYRSTISRHSADTFPEIYNRNFRVHPELGLLNSILLNSIYVKYKNEYINKYQIRNDIDFGRTVTIHPRSQKGQYPKEILASEDAKTPRAFMSNNIILMKNVESEYQTLKGLAEQNLKLGHKGIVTSDQRLAEMGGDNNKNNLKYNLRFIQDKPELVEIAIQTDQDSFLALLDQFDPGWNAFIDEKEVPIYRANIGTRVVAVPKGNHNLRFQYHVPGFKAAAIISILTWFTLIGVLIRGIRDKNAQNLTAL